MWELIHRRKTLGRSRNFTSYDVPFLRISPDGSHPGKKRYRIIISRGLFALLKWQVDEPIGLHKGSQEHDGLWLMAPSASGHMLQPIHWGFYSIYTGDILGLPNDPETKLEPFDCLFEIQPEGLVFTW